MRTIAIVFMVLLLFPFGCQKKAAVRPGVPQSPQSAYENGHSQVQQVERIAEEKLESVASTDFSSSPTREKEGMFPDILFGYDRYAIRDTFRPVLLEVASWMMKHNGWTLSIEGHCDERGTDEYNLALGDRRSTAVKDYLVSLGVPPARLMTISYGEDKPLCTERAEVCWAGNRRVHFVMRLRQ